MQSGRTFIVIKDEGVLKSGMVFTYLDSKGDYVFLWAHKPISGINEIKISIEVIEKNFKIM